MSSLGVPYRLVYESKGRATGLTMVQVAILRPGGIVDGPFHMNGLTGPFSGLYYFDYPSTTGYDEGQYLFSVSSPEDGCFPVKRFELFQPPATAADLAEITADLEAATAEISAAATALSGEVDSLNSAIAELSSEIAEISVLTTLIPSLLSAVVPSVIQGGVELVQPIDASTDSSITIFGVVDDTDSIDCNGGNNVELP